MLASCCLKVQKRKKQTMEENMSNLTTASNEASVSSTNRNDTSAANLYFPTLNQPHHPIPAKRKRNQPGHPDPDAEVIALSPRTLMATNRFVCDVCNKGFQRDQNLQLHRRGHNLPWKLKQRTSKEIRKKVYVCPESSCVHHDPSRALGDLTGIKKHFCRKHGEKKWKCDKCSKQYAVQCDWKAHTKICGTREYRCDCGTLFSRRDSFITHRAFCDALAEESARTTPLETNSSTLSHHINLQQVQSHITNAQNFTFPIKKEQQNFTTTRPEIPPWLTCQPAIGPVTTTPSSVYQDHDQNSNPNPSTSILGPTTLSSYHPPPPPHISATALLQKAAQMGAKSSTTNQCESTAGVFSIPHHHSHVPAGFGLNLSSRDHEFINSLASYGNKAAIAAVVTGGNVTDTYGAAPAAAGETSNSPSPSLLHDMIMNNPHPITSFEDVTFDGILNHQSKNKDCESFHATLGHFSSSGGGSDGMTRDFLGLRPLSQSDILSIMNKNDCINYEHQNQNHKSWQG